MHADSAILLITCPDQRVLVATVADLLRTLPAAPRQAHCLRPRDHGLRHLGHLDWFRQSHQSVWPLMARAVRGEAVLSAPGH